MRKFVALLTVSFVLSVQGGLSSQSVGGLEAARNYVDKHWAEVLEEFVALLKIPNIASNREDLWRNARVLLDMLSKRGVAAEILEAGGAPFVIGSLEAPQAQGTLLLYAHYDGQPVDPARWTGSHPFEPVLRDAGLDDGGAVIPLPVVERPNDDWRLYARSASDDKAPIVAMLVALDALRASGVPLTFNLRFLFEGEEEAGSPNLQEFLKQYGTRLASDAVLVADGPVFITGEPTLYFGARGITTLEITVYGARHPLHSGHYGNWAPNPAMMLAELLSSMKDSDGRVQVAGFYDGIVPLSPLERTYLDRIPRVEAQLMADLWIAQPETSARLVESINLPSLNVRGMNSGWVGEQARTIIPDSATASLDLRLVHGIDPSVQEDRVINHIRQNGYRVVGEEPDAMTRAESPKLARVVRGRGYPAYRSPMELPLCRRMVDSMEESFESIVVLPTLGGSVPLYLFHKVLGVDAIIGVPIVNPDNNQHSPNENLRLGNFFSGIETFAVLFSSKAEESR